MYSMHTVSFSEDFKVLLNLTDNSAASADIDNSLTKFTELMSAATDNLFNRQQTVFGTIHPTTSPP